MIEKIKLLIGKILAFTTGLGFYGLGLLAIGLTVKIALGWTVVGSGLIGAFIYKNYVAIVDLVKGGVPINR